MELRNVLVTGGTGVTGVALVRYLLSKNIKVVALVRKNSFRLKYLPINDANLEIVNCNMEDYPVMGDALKEKGPYDVFFHLSWDGSTIVNKGNSRDDMLLQSKNIVHAINAVELCKAIDCPEFIMTGSQAEFGPYDTDIDESFLSKPINGYGNAKLCVENMSRIMCRNYGIKHIWARLFSIYGPYDGTNSLIYTSILKLLKGENPAYTKGEQMWDFMYSFDAAKALVLLAEKGRDGEMYCVANGNTKPLNEYISVIHKVCAPDIIPKIGDIPYSKGQMMHLGADITKLKKDTGFEPDYSFEEGITEIRDWCVKTNEEYYIRPEDK